MPTYEYQCAACGEHTEKFQKISDDPLLICPHCHQANLERQLSASGFQLKGTGWYVTDFRDKGKPVSKSADKPVDSAEKTAEAKPPQTKPAAAANTDEK